MSHLLIKPNLDQTTLQEVTTASAGWRYIDFSVIQLKPGEQHAFQALDDREYCLTLLCGHADIQVDDTSFDGLGDRSSVFEEKSPYAVYVPPCCQVSILAHDAIEVAISAAPAEGRFPPRLIEPEQMKRSVRGSGSNTRYICDILPETAEAESLLVVEVVTPAGNTSSYPPHKHDQQREHETLLEETYYHRLNPPQGFAFQRVYTGDRALDETMAVENHDVVLVPKGYHPCGTVHGYDLYYLNTMAGPERRWQFFNDPDHAWLFQPTAA
ncbi:MAG: 5-deoxy-glucuronate isomerase [Lautropia sp.]|nr:5-deoxy-glucuronate isomerase [Lautropia sp.]